MSQPSDERMRRFVKSTAGYMSTKEAAAQWDRNPPESYVYENRAKMFDSVIREAREIAEKYLKEEE
jgi:hypothetical protein